MTLEPARPQPSREAQLQALVASAVRRRSGLYVPTGLDEAPAAAPPDSPEERAQDMMLCAPTADDLELPEPTLKGILETLRSIPL